MDFAWWAVDAARPVFATAVHAGHDLRPEVASLTILDDATRLHEEDPRTGYLAAATGSCVVVNRSRFEVDLNRPLEEAVYRQPDDAWGLDLWQGGVLPIETVENSRRLHVEFYHRLRQVLDDLLDRHGGFVLYDVHSYNDRPKKGAASGPFVNLGTGSLPRRWRPVADAFLESMRSAEVSGKPLDAEENVVFRGRHVAGFVHDLYGETACALAIEFKKSFLDEWSGEVNPEAVTALATALAASVDPTWKAHQACR